MSRTDTPHRRLRAGVLATLLVMAAAPLHAQRGNSTPVELGIDGAITRVSTNGPSYTRVAIPMESFRVGFFVSPRVSVEPAMRVLWVKQGDNSATSFDLNAGLMLHTRRVRGAPQLFLRPLVGMTGMNSEDDSRNQPYIDIGGGLKVHGANRLAFRTSLEYQHALESRPLPTQDRVSLLFGVSYFTR